MQTEGSCFDERLVTTWEGELTVRMDKGVLEFEADTVEKLADVVMLLVAFAIGTALLVTGTELQAVICTGS